MTDTIVVRGLELQANLGWRDKELLQPQAIMLDLELYFSKKPKATQTDDLKDTVCYATLIEKIRDKIASKKYRLLEHLTEEVADVISDNIKNIAFKVTIIKKPNIQGLVGGVSYTQYREST